MAARFNPPPGWPPAPQGWTPPPGWAPDPSWPAPPPGWQLWVDDAVPAVGALAQHAGGAPDASRFASPDATVTQKVPAPGPVSSFDAQPGGWSSGPAGMPPPGGPVGPPPPGGPSSTSKQWLIPVIIAVVALFAIVGVLFATGVIGGDSKASSQQESATPKKTDKASATPSKEPSEEPSEEPSDEPSDEPGTSPAGENGTRSAPLAPGGVATLTSWSISMSTSNLDAWAEISTVESEYYKPEDGFVYLMAPATVTFTGEDRSTVSDLEWVFVSADGIAYVDPCGYANLPTALDQGQELYTDATVAGNVCVTVPTENVAGGVWRVGSWWDGEDAYFGLS